MALVPLALEENGAFAAHQAGNGLQKGENKLSSQIPTDHLYELVNTSRLTCHYTGHTVGLDSQNRETALFLLQNVLCVSEAVRLHSKQMYGRPISLL